jgi:hypothetical protein
VCTLAVKREKKKGRFRHVGSDHSLVRIIKNTGQLLQMLWMPYISCVFETLQMDTVNIFSTKSLILVTHKIFLCVRNMKTLPSVSEL